MGIGVFCDDTAKYNEAVNYFKTGIGNGSLLNTFWQPTGQIAEMGRDQPHASLGPAALAEMCQTAWNQGLDLYSYSDNRLMTGFEYYCKYNLNHSVPWVPWNNCINDNLLYVAPSGANRIRQSPVYEMLYNHYYVLQGLNTPYIKAMANLARPEQAGDADFFGCGTLAYTLNAAASPFPAYPIPVVPTGLTATAGVSQVTLNWTGPAGDVAQGYNILRSTSSGGSYITIASWSDNTSTTYTDWTAVNGTTYYYVVSAINQSGTSGNSTEVSAKPISAGSVLPNGWARKDIGNVGVAGNAAYANVSNNTYIVSGSGADIGGNTDSFSYAYSIVSGDFTITARLLTVNWNAVTGGEKVGIVMRETLDPNAKMLTASLGELGNRYARLGTRSSTGGSTSWIEGNHFSAAPVWFRMQRSGNTFTMSESGDGLTWSVVGSSTVTMASTYYVGLSACAGTTGTLVTTATFDNVTTVGGGNIPAAPTSLTATALTGSKIKLVWTSSSGASAYNIKHSLSSGGPYSTIAIGVTDTTFIDSGLVAATNYYYSVKAANGKGESADSVKANAQTMALSLPPAPTGLNAIAGNSSVALTWNTTEGAPSSYKVKRSISLGGPYTLVKSSATTACIDSTAVNGSMYFYTISAVNSLGEGPASVPDSVFLGMKLKGTLIGTPGSWNNDPTTTIAAAVDSNLTTYFDANQLDGAWVGYDFGLGKSALVTRISFAPRSSTPGRMVGGIFQGANASDFSDAVALFTVSTQPPVGVYTEQLISNQGTYRYLRYLSPAGGNGNIADVQFWGKLQTAVVTTVPGATTGLTTTPGDAQATLSWNSAVGASSYKIKRATAKSGPFANIATVGATTFTDTQLTNGLTYYYTVTGINTIGEGPESAPDSVYLTPKITGTIIGTSGSWNNNASVTKKAAMDGNLNTYFDASQTDGDWVGLDLGSDSSAMVTKLSFAPRSTFPQRMIGGIFQGANTPDFSDAVTLYTVTASPAVGVLTFQNISNGTYFRYLRYLSPNGGSGNVAEVNFYGNIQIGRSIPAAPTGLSALQGDAKVTLNWTPTPDAVSYNVRRAVISGGPYTTIASNDTFTSYVDATVNTGSTYFYIVTAINRKGEGPASSPVNIFVGKKLTGTITGTSGSWNNDPSTTKTAAMDGNLNTYFDANQTDGAWTGLDLGPDNIAKVTQVSFAPRSTFPQRMIGGVFQGANKPDFTDAIALYTVASQPPVGLYTSQAISNTTYFRYMRYLSPNGGSGNIAEVNFYGQTKRTQIVTFSPIGKKWIGDADMVLTATASSGLPVNFTSSDTTVATVVNGKIHIKGTGTSIITSSQVGDDSYAAAAAVSQILTVIPLNLQVQYQDGDTGQLTNNIARPYLKVVNADSVGVAYSELTMRYWFTAENYAGINTWIDYAQLGNSNVKMKYVALDQPRNGALGYIEYSFAVTGNLGANSSTGQIQSRLANQDWGLLNEADDYSYQSNTGSYANNNHITLYRNGMLIWGTEPAAVIPLTSLNVFYQNQNTGTSGNAISTYLSVNNTGNVPVSFGDITARYWFTKDGTQNLNYWIDYAKKGSGNISGNFVPLTTALTGADTYLELAVNSSAGTLYPLSSSGNIQYRITKADWSNFNEQNDYSYMAKDVMKENNHITVYYKGQLIYGTEPPSGSMSFKSAPVAVAPPQRDISNEGIVVHQGLSPNGDGINDVLIIDGLTAYPDNKLTIMNRSGVKIFEAKGYDNSSNVFDGHSSISGTMQQPGTYFYTLEYKKGEENKHKTGFIIIKY
ncbi:hypothetical protein GCM10022210_49560 [Mucilaginibacter dorajii]|uniref:Uncharacterized protein n=2 Tax=Mucilaginibacter dorajii TaxID=692994 RepID=A0ABP7QZ03_9SPHI